MSAVLTDGSAVAGRACAEALADAVHSADGVAQYSVAPGAIPTGCRQSLTPTRLKAVRMRATYGGGRCSSGEPTVLRSDIVVGVAVGRARLAEEAPVMEASKAATSIAELLNKSVEIQPGSDRRVPQLLVIYRVRAARSRGSTAEGLRRSALARRPRPPSKLQDGSPQDYFGSSLVFVREEADDEEVSTPDPTHRGTREIEGRNSRRHYSHFRSADTGGSEGRRGRSRLHCYTHPSITTMSTVSS